MLALEWLRPILIGIWAVTLIGTLLSLSRRSHWIFRLWDFPRVQIAAAAAAGAVAYALLFHDRTAFDVTLILSGAAVVVWQLYRIHTYTPFVRATVRRVDDSNAVPANRISLLVTNVLMENEEYDRLIALAGQVEPDVILAVEIDDRWMAALEPLTATYRYRVAQPQSNYYGMLLLSRLELIDPRVQFLVQEDVPSIRTGIRLRSGSEVVLYGLHPRPPEPVRDQPSSPRDAELVVVGRTISRDDPRPTIVAGDLNDVAWSSTSELFVRLSGLLDPRAGRGFYNSYNARNPLFRFPLDHVFHSNHFELVRLERLPSIGSDHFPILVELQYTPAAEKEQEPSKQHGADEHLADEKLEQQAEDRATGSDRPKE